MTKIVSEDRVLRLMISSFARYLRLSIPVILLFAALPQAAISAVISIHRIKPGGHHILPAGERFEGSWMGRTNRADQARRRARVPFQRNYKHRAEDLALLGLSAVSTFSEFEASYRARVHAEPRTLQARSPERNAYLRLRQTRYWLETNGFKKPGDLALVTITPIGMPLGLGLVLEHAESQYRSEDLLRGKAKAEDHEFLERREIWRKRLDDERDAVVELPEFHEASRRSSPYREVISGLRNLLYKKYVNEGGYTHEKALSVIKQEIRKIDFRRTAFVLYVDSDLPLDHPDRVKQIVRVFDGSVEFNSSLDLSGNFIRDGGVQLDPDTAFSNFRQSLTERLTTHHLTPQGLIAPSMTRLPMKYVYENLELPFSPVEFELGRLAGDKNVASPDAAYFELARILVAAHGWHDRGGNVFLPDGPIYLTTSNEIIPGRRISHVEFYQSPVGGGFQIAEVEHPLEERVMFQSLLNFVKKAYSRKNRENPHFRDAIRNQMAGYEPVDAPRENQWFAPKSEPEGPDPGPSEPAEPLGWDPPQSGH